MDGGVVPVKHFIQQLGANTLVATTTEFPKKTYTTNVNASEDLLDRVIFHLDRSAQTPVQCSIIYTDTILTFKVSLPLPSQELTDFVRIAFGIYFVEVRYHKLSETLTKLGAESHVTLEQNDGTYTLSISLPWHTLSDRLTGTSIPM